MSESTTYGQSLIHNIIRLQRQFRLMEDHMIRMRLSHAPHIGDVKNIADLVKYQKPEEPSGITEEDIIGVRKLDL